MATEFVRLNNEVNARRLFRQREIFPADPRTLEAEETAAAEFARLSEADVREYERARQWFCEHGRFAQARMALRHEDSEKRVAAARLLGDVGSDLATADLIPALFDPNPEVSAAAVEALNRIGDDGVNVNSLNALFVRSEAVLDREVVEIVEPAQQLIVVNPKLHGLPRSLVEDLMSISADRRARALSKLAQTEDVNSVDVIVDYFDDPSDDVRKAAAIALSEVGSQQSAECFAEVFKRTATERHHELAGVIVSSGVAASAVRDLGNVDRERVYNSLCLLALIAKCGAVEPLVEAVEHHSSAEVRSAAVKLLNLSGQQDVARAAVKRRLNLA